MSEIDLIGDLDFELNLAGFKKKSKTWYYDEEEVIKVVNLQKSNHSNLFYVNISVFLKGIDSGKQYPKEQECHIRTRLNSSFVDLNQDYNYLFDLENLDLNKDQFKNEIKLCVKRNILPQLEAIKSKEGIEKIAIKNKSILNMLPLKVKTFFNL